ncbi:MAG: hypothetical protein EOM23_03305 [Candidatus Moranbacteria bacterium]|nr:hypothetical protein [Candidatus Moranbacteria bacterium]
MVTVIIRSFLVTRNTWIIFIIVCVVSLGGLIYLSNKNRVDINVDEIDQSAVQPATEASGNIADHVLGNPESKIVLIEYADFQCPGCAGSYDQTKSLAQKYGDDIAIVLRNFPITSLHPHALASSATAEAAGLQGKYWEMADLLFTNQNEWSPLNAVDRSTTFEAYAQQLQLDIEKFKADQASAAVKQKIDFDQSLAKKDNVEATPSFFLNGRALSQEEWNDDKWWNTS